MSLTSPFYRPTIIGLHRTQHRATNAHQRWAIEMAYRCRWWPNVVCLVRAGNFSLISAKTYDLDV